MKLSISLKGNNVEAVIEEIKKQLDESLHSKHIRFTEENFVCDSIRTAQIKCISIVYSKVEITHIVGLIILDKLPESTNELEKILKWAEALLNSASGNFELGLSPFLKVNNVLPMGNYHACNRLVDNTILLEDYEDCIWQFTDIDVDKEWPIIVQQKYHSHVISCMLKLEIERKISHKTILSHFILHEDYGIDSIWYSEVFKKNVALFNYYTLLSRSAASCSKDIVPEELGEWRPQRTIDIWTSANLEEGYLCIGSYVFSPLEYELFLYSSGKLTLHQILEIVFLQFGSKFEERDEFREIVMSILKIFEDKFWLVYVAI